MDYATQNPPPDTAFSFSSSSPRINFNLHNKELEKNPSRKELNKEDIAVGTISFEEHKDENGISSNPSLSTEEDDTSSEDELKQSQLRMVTGAPLDDILPVELMLEVFSYLTAKELTVVRLVSWNWKKLADDEQLWYRLYKQIFDVSADCRMSRYEETLSNRKKDKKFRISINWKRAFKSSIKWCWSSLDNQKASEVELSNHNLTATDACAKLNQPVSWTTCLGSPAISSGRHYFEIHIDKTDPHNRIKVVFGCTASSPFALKSNVPFGYNTMDHNSWCYRGDGVIMIRGLPDSIKGKPYREGDSVGLKLNFKKKTISFFKNGEFQGRRGTGISGEIFPAVSLIGGNQVTIQHTVHIPKHSTSERSQQKTPFTVSSPMSSTFPGRSPKLPTLMKQLELNATGNQSNTNNNQSNQSGTSNNYNRSNNNYNKNKISSINNNDNKNKNNKSGNDGGVYIIHNNDNNNDNSNNNSARSNPIATKRSMNTPLSTVSSLKES